MDWNLSLIVLGSWLSLLFAWCSLAFAIGGLAAVQSSCTSNRLTILLSGVSNLSNAGTSCNRFFSYQWFTVLFMVVLLVLVTCCAFNTRWFYALRTPLLPLFSVAIVLSMQGADTFVKMYDHVEINGDAATQAAITFSGFIASAVVLCALVVAFSASFEYKSSPHRVVAPPKTPERVVDETTGTSLVADSSIPPLPPPEPREEA